MKDNKKRIFWITRTAIFIALLIVVQFATKPLSQYVTGSAVNLLLIMSVMICGLSSGMTVAALSPVFAMLFGIGPALWILTPFIVLGNCAIVLIWYLIGIRAFKDKFVGYLVALPAGAAGKFLVLYLTIVRLLLPLFLHLPAKQAAVITAAFSLTQLITALIGGAVAVAALPLVRKATAARQG